MLSLYEDPRGDKKVTVKELIDFAETLKELGLPDDYRLETCDISLDIRSGSIEPVLCGDCAPGEIKNDMLINLHQH